MSVHVYDVSSLCRTDSVSKHHVLLGTSPKNEAQISELEQKSMHYM